MYAGITEKDRIATTDDGLDVYLTYISFITAPAPNHCCEHQTCL